MFVAKKQNPIILLLGLIGVLFMMFMMLQSMIQQPSQEVEEVMPDRGNVWNTEAELEPFVVKAHKELSTLLPSLSNVGDSFLLRKREELFNYLSLDLNWKHLKKMPYRYIGSLMPTSVKSQGRVLEGEFEDVIEFDHEGQKLWVYFQEMPEEIADSVYMDLIFLGQVKHQGRQGWVGVAKQLFDLPNQGLYEMMATDKIALNEVVDEMENKALQEETRRVSSLALKHFFGKVQRKDHEGKELMQAGYIDLMQQPERYRGGLVSFTGTLIHLERKMFPKGQVAPGMEFYYQGYLLNSDQILYLFRSLEMPKVELKAVLNVNGYFLQRYNFLNRQNRATWVPLLVATSVEKEKERGVDMSEGEKKTFGTVVLLIFVVLTWLLFRSNKVQKKIKVKNVRKGPLKAKSSVKKES